MSGVNGKVAIITGASSGMGKAMAELFAEKGAKVVACDINYEALESVVSAIRETGARKHIRSSRNGRSRSRRPRSWKKTYRIRRGIRCISCRFFSL